MESPIQQPTPIDVRVDKLASAEVQALIAEHLAGMHGNSPPGHVNALAIEGLQRPEVTFWSAWQGSTLCGCGALKELDALSGEVKSMRTRPAHLRNGVGQTVLDEIVRTAMARGYTDLYLETGTGPAFVAAHALYLKNGFAWCGPFGDYVATEFNVFMVKRLQPPTLLQPEGPEGEAPMNLVGPDLKRQPEIETILRSLPQWFGIESALQMYVADSATRPTLALEIGGELVGFLTLTRHFPLSWEVHCMAVSAARRNGGIGSQLLQHAEQYVQQQGGRYLQVKTVAETSPSAAYAQTRKFYEARGFTPLEVFPTLWDPWNPALQLVKGVSAG